MDSPGEEKLGVIFDMDGVIVDTEPIHARAMKAVLGAREVELLESLFRTFVGRRAEECYGQLKSQYSLGDAVADLIREHDEHFARLLRQQLEQEQLQPLQGLRGFLEKIDRAGFARGLVSSSPRWQVDYILECLGLQDFFKVTLAGDEVQEGKPAPEGFLKCAGRLGLPPHACAVIEDSPHGIEAARRASMKAVALASPYFSKDVYRDADWVVSSFAELSAEGVRSLLKRS